MYVTVFHVIDLTTTKPTQSGPSHAITDVTQAAGWTTVHCHPNKTEQDIRVVCTSPSAECGHLFANGGAEGKIVRLPEHVMFSSLALAALES